MAWHGRSALFLLQRSSCCCTSSCLHLSFSLSTSAENHEEAEPASMEVDGEDDEDEQRRMVGGGGRACVTWSGKFYVWES